jgi:predicted aspartyl protease
MLAGFVCSGGGPCLGGDEAVEVAFEVVGKVVFVKGQANEQGPMTFILDTGATETILTPAAAEKAGVSAGAPAGQPVKKGMAKSVSVGQAAVRNLPVHVFDPPQALSLRLDKGVNYHGILGYTFLCRFVTTIDYARQRVRFVPVAQVPREDERAGARAGRIVVPFQLKDNLIHAKGELNGKFPVIFLVDTGSAEALLLPQAVPALDEKAAPLPGYEGVKQLTVDTVSLGGARASQVPFIIHAPPQERRARPGYDGMLGYPFLSNFVVTVNYRDKLLVFAVPEARNGNGREKGGQKP